MPMVEKTVSLKTTEASSQARCVYRVDVLPLAPAWAETISLPGVGELTASPIYWFDAPVGWDDAIHHIARELLIDPILQRYTVSTVDVPVLATPPEWTWLLQRQFLPGVTDNLAATVAKSLPLLFPGQTLPKIQVASGTLYGGCPHDATPDQLSRQAENVLFNPLIERFTVFHASKAVQDSAWLHFPRVSGVVPPMPAVMDLSGTDADLMALSRDRCLALMLEEMHAVRDHFLDPDHRAKRAKKGLPAWPTDVELEILAQTWSEHCKHKIFAARITYVDSTHPDFPQTDVIDGLFQTYIAGATRKLASQRPDLLSVFKDNAGVLRWDADYGICFKVETHNSPSALEPYGGALTGIVGVNRDILGTGLGAKPLFNTDVFCFAHPEAPHAGRPTMLPPEAILTGVRKGVEDGGNKSGIPTVNGALFFDPRYRAKPLVFCGTGGILPLRAPDPSEQALSETSRDGAATFVLGYEKYTRAGDTLVMAGGRVGKDGIHGATFSSEALHQDSPVSAVQIGDPLTQKRMTDFLIAARDAGLFTGVTDNGAGGLSSSVGEMAQITGGAEIHLDRVPVKYPGLAAYELVISESQERMTLSTRDFQALQTLADLYDVEVSAIGTFHDRGTFDVFDEGRCVAALDLDFLHYGLPRMDLKAHWQPEKARGIRAQAPADPAEILCKLLASPNLCSREALIRQYDHEVQGRSVIKPLMGPHQTAPCDAAVLQPVLGDVQGLVVSNGLCPQYGDWDTYPMAACAVDEAVRNAVAVGADPESIALLDNFCWPDPLPSARNPEAAHKLAQLVRACQGLHDVAVAYGTPFISGKDSMKNDFDDGTLRLSIPPTVLVSAIGRMPDCTRAVTMAFKTPGDVVFVLGKTNVHMGGSEYHQLMGWYSPYCPQVPIPLARTLYRTLYRCIQHGWIRSCHDCSEGGLAVALAECVLGGVVGAEVSLQAVLEDSPELRWDEALFSESPSRLVLSVSPEHCAAVEEAFTGLPLLPLGRVTPEPILRLEASDREGPGMQVSREALLSAWRRAPAACYAGGMVP